MNDYVHTNIERDEVEVTGRGRPAKHQLFVSRAHNSNRILRAQVDYGPGPPDWELVIRKSKR